MQKFAEITSLVYPLQEIQDRASLEIPTEYFREESISESSDQQIAHYRLTYYVRADNDPSGETIDVRAKFDQIVPDVMRNNDYADMVWEITEDERGRNERGITVTVTWEEDQPQEEPLFTGAYRQANDAMSVVPLTVYADQDVYNVATDGNTFQVLHNGKPVVEDAPSAAYALGAMVPLLRDALQQIEHTNGMEPSGSNDFLAGIAMAIVDSPEITDEAKEHFVTFYELTTLRDWDAVTEDPDEI